MNSKCSGLQDSSIALRFKDVCFAYDREEVIHNVDLAIPEGSFVAVVGPNGGGKSTLMKLALGLLRPDRGHVRVFGQTPERLRCRVGYVPQHLRFDAAFPVSSLDVVLMARSDRHWFGPYRQEDRQKAKSALRRVGMAHLADRGFSHLSGGERQRVLIAQALVSDPDMIFLDEPTANVDASMEHEIYELLRELNQHKTVLVVSHNLNVVTRHASHLACVNRTASLERIGALTERQLHRFYRGDMTVFKHGTDCHVLDASKAMREPHHGTAEG
ncbi:metal ABC transporter ATP-binding protein [Crateriforma spongiae]|uniref:metal ABC transporter ATP-binding protein n=1 Tax=Crateriforma spongiae TaxID=2724528 RepID=UPI00144809CD|nr:ABC transporter ATP-binding protein [Crateriforma spongiae]